MKTKSIVFSILVIIVVCSILSTSLVACNKDEYNYVIGVQSGTTGESYISGFSKVDTKGYDTGAEAVAALLNDQIDFVVIDSATASALANNKDNAGKIKIIDIELSKEEYGIAITKGQTELKNTINTVLDRIIQDGTLDTIINNFVNGVPSTGYVSTSPDESKKSSEFVVALNAGFEPFEFKDEVNNNKYYGIDIEIAKLIAEELEQTLVIYDTDFELVLDAVGNIADVAISGITINEERKAYVDFSTAYYKDSSQKIIVKADSTIFDNCKSEDDIKKILNK